MRAFKRLWWVAPTVLIGCCVGLWSLEQIVIPESNGALGGLLGLMVGGPAAQLAEHSVGHL